MNNHDEFNFNNDSVVDFWNHILEKMGGDDHQVFGIEKGFNESSAIEQWKNKCKKD